MRTLLLLAALTTCACHHSGEWTDDPANPSRAWGTAAAEGLHPVHSSYWRSWHFTREEVLFFQFAPAPHVKAGFIQGNRLVPADATAALASGFCRTRPSWFAPKPLHSYAAWAPTSASPGEPSRIILLEDRETGSLFFYGCQM